MAFLLYEIARASSGALAWQKIFRMSRKHAV